MPSNEPEYRRRVREKREQNKREAQREREKASEDTRIEKIITSIEGIVKQIDRYADENAPENRSKRHWENAGVIGLWAAAAVGAFAIIIGSRDSSHQLNVMRGQLGEMHAENRPWVGFAVSNTPLVAGKKFVVQFEYTNVGHSPAFRFRSCAGIDPINSGKSDPVPLDDCAKAPFPIPHGMSTSTLLPGTSPVSEIVPLGTAQFLTQADVDNVNDGSVTVWALGRVEYEDAAGISHWTTLRGKYDPTIGAFVYTDTGNDAN